MKFKRELMKESILSRIRTYLLAGLFVWVPIIVTIWVVKFFVQLLDGVLLLLPRSYQPHVMLGFHLPGMGVLLCLIILFFTGMIASNFLGQYLVLLSDKIIKRIPIIRSVYAAVKQIMETLFHSSGQAFRKVLLVEYPRKGLWTIAFQAGRVTDEMNRAAGDELVAAFIPTTPNPTSGFLIFVPKAEVQELKMSVDAGLKFVISLGAVQAGMPKEELDKLLKK